MTIIMKGLSFFGLVFLLGMSCNLKNTGTEKAAKKIVDTISVLSNKADGLVLQQQLKFKKWVKDTIPKINVTGYFKERQIVLRDDSLLIQITDKYELKVDGRFKTKVDDINAALDLLKIYNDKPSETFRLDYWITNYYLPSMYPRFDYEYAYDIEKFVVSTKDSLIDYAFIKGNLTGRKARVNNLK